MKLLLDTHALLWHLAGNDKVTPSARATIGQGDNLKLVSLVTLWSLLQNPRKDGRGGTRPSRNPPKSSVFANGGPASTPAAGVLQEALWEMAIMVSLGRLSIREPLESFMLSQMETNDFHLLHIQASHACRVAVLPFHHRDPFDRLLVAQCLSDDLTLISGDTAFDAYGVTRIW